MVLPWRNQSTRPACPLYDRRGSEQHFVYVQLVVLSEAWTDTPADRSHVELADLYGSSNETAANRHREAAERIRQAILDLCWDSEKV